jgi:hypothetical protein
MRERRKKVLLMTNHYVFLLLTLIYTKKKTYQDSSNVDLKKFEGSKHKIPKDKKNKNTL